MVELIGACISQFHNDADSFELLLSYSDGREIGHVISRSVGEKMAAEFADAFGAPYQHVEVDNH